MLPNSSPGWFGAFRELVINWSSYLWLMGYIYIWVNYNDLTATSLEIMVSKGNDPQMALFQVSELL